MHDSSIYIYDLYVRKLEYKMSIEANNSVTFATKCRHSNQVIISHSIIYISHYLEIL